jgi:tRNA nucleotidyltransferase (CCA-adding enzyme)
MIRAKYIMCKRAAVQESESGKEVVFKMMGTGCPGLPVVNGQMEIVGIITAFDVLKAIRKGVEIDALTVGNVMSKAPLSADLNTPLEMLIDIIIDNNYTIIPITNNNRLVGVVSRNEILQAYAEPHMYQFFEE